MRRTVILSLAAVLLCCAAHAQIRAMNPFGTGLFSAVPNRLFDPSRFQMRQSISFGYFSSNQGSFVSNYYNNNVNYRLTDKLQLNLNLGVQYTPSQLATSPVFKSLPSRQGLVIPSVGIRYQPSDFFTLEFQYNRYDPLGQYEPWR